MTTVPPGEAEPPNSPQHDPPEASLGNGADNGSADSLTGGPPNPDPLPALAPAPGSTAVFAEHQDGDQASFETAASQPQSPSGDGDKDVVAPGDSQGGPEETESLLPQDPGILQVFVGFQNPVWDRLAENTRKSQSRTASPSDSQIRERTPQKASAPEGQPELAPSTPNAEVQSAQSEEVQPSEGTTDPSTDDTSGQLDIQATETTTAAEPEAEVLNALNLDREAGSWTAPGQNLADDSRDWQVPSFPPSPAGSVPSSPGANQRAPGRGLLDSRLYGADEENDYMRSMTSLLGGGEGTISSLADILVWSDATMGMSMAMSFLASGHSSPTELLHTPGPSLRSVSSIVGSARSTFSSGVASGTGSALRSVTHMLETVERRAVEGIRSAVRYLTSHLTPRRAPADSNCD